MKCLYYIYIGPRHGERTEVRSIDVKQNTFGAQEMPSNCRFQVRKVEFQLLERQSCLGPKYENAVIEGASGQIRPDDHCNNLVFANPSYADVTVFQDSTSLLYDISRNLLKLHVSCW
jgi:hypothetical protein